MLAGMQIEFVDPIFDFCKSMAKLDLDEAEYALLVAINTFSSGNLITLLVVLNFCITTHLMLK